MAFKIDLVHGGEFICLNCGSTIFNNFKMSSTNPETIKKMQILGTEFNCFYCGKSHTIKHTKVTMLHHVEVP